MNCMPTTLGMTPSCFPCGWRFAQRSRNHLRIQEDIARLRNKHSWMVACEVDFRDRLCNQSKLIQRAYFSRLSLSTVYLLTGDMNEVLYWWDLVNVTAYVCMKLLLVSVLWFARTFCSLMQNIRPFLLNLAQLVPSNRSIQLCKPVRRRLVIAWSGYNYQ